MKQKTLLLMLVAATSLGAQSHSGEGDPRSGIPFEVDRRFGTILIRAQVNGHPATLVLDTGSSNTILSSELLQVRVLALDHADGPAKGSGYVGTAGWANATVEIGALKWSDRRVLVMNDLEDISKSMKQRIDGILGDDLLKELASISIDFKHHRILVSQ